jgi:hypothetical protein
MNKGGLRPLRRLAANVSLDPGRVCVLESASYMRDQLLYPEVLHRDTGCAGFSANSTPEMQEHDAIDDE